MLFRSPRVVYSQQWYALTSDIPNVSHLAKLLGNMGKSTARILRMVITSMWPRYGVNAGICFLILWSIAFLSLELLFSAFSGDKDIDDVGDDGCGSWGRAGCRRSKSVGKRRIPLGIKGILAKTVMESRRGRTIRINSVTRLKPFFWGCRDRRAECNAIEDYKKGSMRRINEERTIN